MPSTIHTTYHPFRGRNIFKKQTQNCIFFKQSAHFRAEKLFYGVKPVQISCYRLLMFSLDFPGPHKIFSTQTLWFYKQNTAPKSYAKKYIFFASMLFTKLLWKIVGGLKSFVKHKYLVTWHYNMKKKQKILCMKQLIISCKNLVKIFLKNQFFFSVLKHYFTTYLLKTALISYQKRFTLTTSH